MKRNREFIEASASSNIKKKCKTSATIYSLPNELLIIIMENLSIYDRMSFGMTCRRFHNVFNSTQKLNRDKIVKIGKNNYDTFIKLFTTETSEYICHAILPNIEFKCCSTMNFNKNFWREYGKNVLSITFEDCNFKENNILRLIISTCENLEEFTTKLLKNNEILNACSTLKYEKLKKIETNYLTDYALNNFIINAPKLKCFIAYNYKFKSEEEDKNSNSDKTINTAKAENIRVPIDENANENQLTFRNLMQVLPQSKITSFCETDPTFNFKIAPINLTSGITYDFRQIKNICKLKEFGLELEDITLKNNCHQFNMNGFNLLTNTYGNSIKYLKLVQNFWSHYPLPDFQKFTNLKTLILSDRILIEKNFMNISFLKNLETLHFADSGLMRMDDNIGSCENVIHNVLTNLPNLRRLSIKETSLPKMHLFLNSTSVELIELHLVNCTKMKIKQILAALYKNHTSLRKLTLISKRSFITDEHVKVEIKKLSYKSIHRITIEKYQVGLSSLKNLDYLVLGNTLITDKTITEEFKWNELKTLKLFENKNITDAALLSLSKNCPALVELSLLHCKSITDEGIKYLCDLTRLRKINLWGTSATAVGINYLIKSSCPLSQCEIFKRVFKSDKTLLEKLNKKLGHIY